MCWRARSSRRSRWAASARPRRSPAAWCSWPARRPASSPAPASTPTAGSTWPEVGGNRMTALTEIETPCLLLDLDRLERNLARMREHCRGRGVQLRPHLKTAKSVDVARLAAGGAPMPATVSTLQEASCFAHAGYRDLLLATPVVPSKL